MGLGLSFGGSEEAGGASSKVPPGVRARPSAAKGKFLRILSVNDVYTLDNYASLRTAIKRNRDSAAALDCTFVSVLNGDFVSPCVMTSLDGGKTMMEALVKSTVDYVCLGNHEFDLGLPGLAAKIKEFPGKCINTNGTAMKELAFLPTHDLIKVGDRVALIGGFCTEDKSIYSPTKMPDLAPVDTSIVKLWDSVTKAGTTPDVFLPMTHQLMAQDRATGAMCAAHEGLKGKTPVLLGGHEHEVFIEELPGGSTIVKVGQNAELFATIDIWWDDTGKLAYEVSTQPAKDWEQDEDVQAFCAAKDTQLKQAMSVPIATLPEAMSSKKVRFEPSKLASLLLSFVKDGLRHEGVEMAFIQGGAVRAGADYEAGPFTMGDLFAEFAFDCPQAVLKLPGRVISESAHNSRNTPKPAPNFLHFDEQVTLSEEGHITHVNGEPFDPDRVYTIAVYQFLVAGGNAIQPLLQYVQDNVSVPHEDCCPPVKNIVLGDMMQKLWRQFLELDGTAAPDEAAIERAFKEIDSNHDGSLDTDELMKAFGSKLDKAHAQGLLEQMVKSLDMNKDGKIDKSELLRITQ